MTIGNVGGWAQVLGDKLSPTEYKVVEKSPIQVNGVFPNLTVMAKGVGSDSEAGIGALIPWAEKLRAVGYVTP